MGNETFKAAPDGQNAWAQRQPGLHGFGAGASGAARLGRGGCGTQFDFLVDDVTGDSPSRQYGRRIPVAQTQHDVGACCDSGVVGGDDEGAAALLGRGEEAIRCGVA